MTENNWILFFETVYRLNSLHPIDQPEVFLCRNSGTLFFRRSSLAYLELDMNTTSCSPLPWGVSHKLSLSCLIASAVSPSKLAIILLQ